MVLLTGLLGRAKTDVFTNECAHVDSTKAELNMAFLKHSRQVP